MKSSFKDPLHPKEEKQSGFPFSFKSPSYDERSSRSIDAGTTYGVGHRIPVGHDGDPKVRVDTLPFGHVHEKK